MIVWTVTLTAPTVARSDSGCTFTDAAAASEAAEAARTLALAYGAPAGSAVTITIDGSVIARAVIGPSAIGHPDPTLVLDIADALDERISA
ncbi:hypothetical protein LSF60_23730 (plasmid) [Rhodococcus pyridinivorans]|uniref:hypothetical protein n=1 Tax=Rhodococcus pyridinivorans TaxID=103816 RepID=UPI001E650997|nr:hypothetical protein [Rhodococcus pyridinivorans]UGQ60494.1 hypothetical protein LSF60_23730 [Rhodococcus pyridinivorans]